MPQRLNRNTTVTCIRKLTLMTMPKSHRTKPAAQSRPRAGNPHAALLPCEYQSCPGGLLDPSPLSKTHMPAGEMTAPTGFRGLLFSVASQGLPSHRAQRSHHLPALLWFKRSARCLTYNISNPYEYIYPIFHMKKLEAPRGDRIC